VTGHGLLSFSDYVNETDRFLQNQSTVEVARLDSRPKKWVQHQHLTRIDQHTQKSK
jgi:hypothetical protein